MNYKKKYLKYKLKYLNFNKNIYLGGYSNDTTQTEQTASDITYRYANVTDSDREISNTLHTFGQVLDPLWQEHLNNTVNNNTVNNNDAELLNNTVNNNDAELLNNTVNNNDTEQTNDENDPLVDYVLNPIIAGLSSYIVYLLYERFS